MDIQELSRREALKALGVTTAEYCSLSALNPALRLPSDELLLQCGAGITACWYLRKSQEINSAAQTVAKYIPTLKDFYEDMAIWFRVGLPFYQKWTYVPSDYQDIYQQALEEMQAPDFVATWTLLTVWCIRSRDGRIMLMRGLT